MYQFRCNLCDAGYVGYNRGHLHERVDGHKRKASSIYKHYKIEQNALVPKNLISQFHVLAKCKNKFDCLVKEMLFIRRLVPDLNVQTDSIRAKVFAQCLILFLFQLFSTFNRSSCNQNIVTRGTGYETLQVSKAITKVLQFMLKVLRPCTIFCFTFAHYS